MEISYILGLIGSVVVTVAYIPQTIKTMATKHTKDLSLPWLFSLSTGLILYSVYGFSISSLPVIISSGFGAVLALILLAYKIRYK